MDDDFFLFSEYRDEGCEARHYICGDYHLWTWSADDGEIDRFDFHFKDRAIKYSGGGFSRGSENYVMPMFFIIEQLFACDADIQAKLLGIRDGYFAESRGAGSGDSGEGLRPAI